MNLESMKLISVETAAEIIGCTTGRVRQILIAGDGHGDIKGEKITQSAWVVDRKSAEKYAKKPAGRGRPRKFA